MHRCGGSLVGLSAAIALARVGFQMTVADWSPAIPRHRAGPAATRRGRCPAARHAGRGRGRTGPPAQRRRPWRRPRRQRGAHPPPGSTPGAPDHSQGHRGRKPPRRWRPAGTPPSCGRWRAGCPWRSSWSFGARRLDCDLLRADVPAFGSSCCRRRPGHPNAMGSACLPRSTLCPSCNPPSLTADR